MESGFHMYCFTQGPVEMSYVPPGYLVAERISASEDCIGIRANVVPTCTSEASLWPSSEKSLRKVADEYVSQKREALSTVVQDAVALMAEKRDVAMQDEEAGVAAEAAAAAAAARVPANTDK